MKSLRNTIVDIKNFCENKKKIYIYGAGDYGKKCKIILDYLHIPVEAFFVTKFSGNEGSYDGVPILQWNSSFHDKKSPVEEIGIIIALSTTWFYEIVSYIEDIPYMYYEPPASSMIEVTTKIGCSVNCKYCPQTNLINAYSKKNNNYYLKMNDWKQILNNISTATFIRFCGMSEPFLNPECANMIVYAKEKGFHIDCYSTLVGLNLSDVDRVLDAVDDFVPHVPDKDGNAIIEVTDEYIEKLKKILDYRRNGKRLVKRISVHGEIHDRIKNLIPCDDDLDVAKRMQDRVGNLDDEDLQLIHYQVHSPMSCEFCHNRLDSNILLPNGDLLMCCMDYGMKHVFGNLLSDPYEKVLNSNEAAMVRNAMVYGNQEILCNTCGFAEELLG